MSRRVVHVDVALPDGDVHAATVTFQNNDGARLISTTFQYTDAWIAAPSTYALSPELPLRTGAARFVGRLLIPGAIADTGPDAWGRRLLFDAARRAALARGELPQSYSDADSVLLASDATRLGNLRYRDPDSTSYLSPQLDGVPTLVDLDALVRAARHASARQEPTESELQLLVAGGTTLGGSRPKVNVRLESGRLALAKLPAHDDRWDVQAWEAVALTLARSARIQVPRFELHRVSDGSSVLVLERFDRTEGDGRTGFWSARTLLEQHDDEEVSYVDLVDAAGVVLADPTADRVELSRRVALNLLINNVDDHMKNHAFLRTERAWRLAPCYDLNPWPWAWAVASTPIGPVGRRAQRSIEELIDAGPAFGLKRDAAVEVVVAVERATRGWADVARGFDVEDPELTPLATAFDNPNRRLVAGW